MLQANSSCPGYGTCTRTSSKSSGARFILRPESPPCAIAATSSNSSPRFATPSRRAVASARDLLARRNRRRLRSARIRRCSGSTPPSRLARWVDRYHEAGFQQMKIYSSVKLEEVKAVADEAHRLGMTVTGHVPEGLNAYPGDRSRAGSDQPHSIHRRHHAPAVPERLSRPDRMKAAADIDLDRQKRRKQSRF